jgi:small subunit ribosomal protein S4
MKRAGKIPRFKMQRRLMTELPGLGKAGALERKPYPPGQHGQQRKKFSEYGLQLEEKQKIRVHYGLRETQLRRFVLKAKSSSDQNWVSALASLLERRLDNLVFRLGFAPSIPSARQLVSHKKIMVNGKVVNIKSFVAEVGDVITLTEAAQTSQDFLKAQMAPRLTLPNFLTVDKGDKGITGKVIDQPATGDIPFPFDAGTFTSYYSGL